MGKRNPMAKNAFKWFIFGDHVLLIGIIFVSISLVLLPVPGYWKLLIPDSLLLVYIYYLLRGHNLFGTLFALIFGIFLDVLFFLPLGVIPSYLIILTYACKKLVRQINYFPLWQQSALVSVFIGVYYLYIYIFGIFKLNDFHTITIIAKMATSFICWPWVAYLLDRIYSRETINDVFS